MKRTLNFINNNWLIITAILSIILIFLSFVSINSGSIKYSGDKYLHTATYFFLSFPASLKKPTNYFVISIYFICFGSIIELMQPYFNRYFELLDILANTIGILLAITFADQLRKYYFYYD